MKIANIHEAKSQLSKLVIQHRALRVHLRRANDSHRRVPAVHLRSMPLTIADGFRRSAG